MDKIDKIQYFEAAIRQIDSAQYFIGSSLGEDSDEYLKLEEVVVKLETMIQEILKQK
jgi:hypothetical protein